MIVRRRAAVTLITALIVGGSILSPAAGTLPAGAVAPTPGHAATAVRDRPGTVPAATTATTAVLGQIRRRITRADDPWNIVLVVTDDQPDGMLGDMPTVRREIQGRGITYPNAIVPTPICCPSRASLLTGLFAARTGVFSNDRNGPGGYSAFVANGNERRTFAVALDRAGYRTGYFGKYLNAYGGAFTGLAPKGWDEWLGFPGSTNGHFYRDYYVPLQLNRRDRDRVLHGLPPTRPIRKSVHRYSTTFLGDRVVRFIRSTPQRKPLLAMFMPYAPHAPFRSQPKYRGTLTDTEWWRSDASFMEQDVSDKPRWVAALPLRSTDFSGARAGANWVSQRQTLLSVDDQIDRIISALRESGRLRRTVIAFTSDNGYLHGQHRLMRKFTPYRGSEEVPLAVRYGDLLAAGIADPRIAAANVDLFATVVNIPGLQPDDPEVAGLAIGDSDGRSLLIPPVREGVPVVAPQYPIQSVVRPPYCGWRTATEQFLRYGSGEEEYYDYTTDPLELTNRVDDPAVTDRVAELRRLTRESCRPTPPRFGPSFDEPRWEYQDPRPPAQ